MISPVESPFSKLGRQLARFGVVGVGNSGIDFAITNILFFMLMPSTPMGLFFISAVACTVAAINSYFINSKWTFKDGAGGPFNIPKFIAVAALGLFINSSVFMGLVTTLPPMLPNLDPVYLINLAKLAGIAVALSVTFLGYRLSVFETEGLATIRNRVHLLGNSNAVNWHKLFVLLILALFSRLVYLYYVPVINGDAVSYIWTAAGIGSGDFASIDVFWHSLFDFWQALFVALGMELYTVVVLSTLIPGLLILIPIYMLTQRLYGSQAAWLATLFSVLHPRMIEFSVNGYQEMFFLNGLLWAIWGLTCIQQQQRHQRLTLLVTGLGLALFFLCRNEAIVFIGLALAVFVFVNRSTNIRTLAPSMAILLIVGGMALIYSQVNIGLWNQHGLFSKTSNLLKEIPETIDMHAGARFSYGTAEKVIQDASLDKVVLSMLSRWPDNMNYIVTKLPGMLMSPLFIFALLLPLLTAKRTTKTYDRWPLLTFIAFPILFYPFIQLEPRMLFPLVIGINIFGAAGVLALVEFTKQQTGKEHVFQVNIRYAIVVTLAVLLVLFTAFLGWNSWQKRYYHHHVGAWIAENISEKTQIYGDGFGYVANSMFWAGRKAIPRPWTETPDQLYQEICAKPGATDQEHVIILYEIYLQKANPEVLFMLDVPPLGFSLMKEFEFERAGRVQVLKLTQCLGSSG